MPLNHWSRDICSKWTEAPWATIFVEGGPAVCQLALRSDLKELPFLHSMGPS